MIISISLEKNRCENLMPAIARTDAKVITLCMSDEVMPEAVENQMKLSIN